MTATYLGTRCCGASTSTPHWVGCRRRLDVNDPRSYHRGDLTDTDHCFYCGRELTEASDGGWWPADYRWVQDAETECDVPMCNACWEKVD